MPTAPTPQSYEQFLSDMASSYAAKIGINDFNTGSISLSFFEVVALVAARSSGDIFQILTNISVDRATGDALKNIAKDNKVPVIVATPTTGYVTVEDTSFTKISTKIYAGSSAPNIGSISIDVADASSFPSSGAIYIGRGTPNVETAINYSSTPVQIGSYWRITLDTTTQKFHNIGETVVLAQGGNRSIPINSVVIAPAVGAKPDIKYNTTALATILDGEVTVENVPVTAQEPGADGRIPIGAIKKFSSVPFSGATVTNPLPFTTGYDSETDEQLRVRIKAAQASTGLGTDTAIQSAILGATSSDEQDSITGSSIVKSSVGSIVYIDNGQGYEAKTAGVGLESIIDSAIGGEKLFQLATGGRQAPVAKAFLQTTLSSPYDLIGGDALAITVGEQTYQHVFSDSDFRSPGGATAYEVCASINSNTTLGFEATTASGGQYVIVRAIAEANDSLQIATPSVSGRDASVQMGFPSSQAQTLRIYKNKTPLSKDGKTASVFTTDQSNWSSSITDGDTLTISVDGTDYITYTIHSSDFIATGLYNQVYYTNSLESWVEVFNNKLTGVTASIVGQQIKLISNLGTSNRAAIVLDATVNPSTNLVNKGMFSSTLGLSSQGQTSDFILDRNTAEFELAEALVAGDSLTVGTDETEARVESNQISNSSLTFTADGYIWILIDSVGQMVTTGLASNTSLTVSSPSTNIVRYTSSVSSAFSNVQVGDYVIIWSKELSSGNRLEGRVNAISNTTLDILIASSEFSSVVLETVLFNSGFSVVRTDNVPQKFRIQTGIKTLNDIVLELSAQTNSVEFSVIEDQYILIKSKTKSSEGRILIVTFDDQTQQLGFTIGETDYSKDSLIAFYSSQQKESSLPLFVHAGFALAEVADPINSYVTSITSTVSLSGRDPNELISFLHPYGAIDDSQPYKETVQEKMVSGATSTITENNLLRRLRLTDRYYLASPLDFGSQDTSVAIVDNDTISQSFEIPFYRLAKTNTTFTVDNFQFNAYDLATGPTQTFAASFPAFDFSNFKVLMQAKKVLKPSPDKTALLYRAAKWGRSGERINVGYIYPSVANSSIGSTIVIDENINIRINLKSDISVGSAIDSTTEWNVSITPNTPVVGIDQVTYSWNSVGTAPALNLVGGEYVNISNQTELDLANTGVFRVSTETGFLPTTNSFTVQRPNGVAVSESDKATLVSNGIVFYNSSATTADEINTYINDNISDYISSTIVNDNGTDGSGIIVLSTFEDSSFAFESVYLLDGINWLQSSSVSSSPNFVFKKALSLPSDVGYAFNDGEEIYFIPTTMDQVSRFISVLAVSGFSTVGSINLSNRASQIELSTDTLGSDGSIQIVGGLANQYETPVLDSATRIDNNLMSISTNKVSAQGIHSDQMFRLEASELQVKETLMSSNTLVSVIPDKPVAGQTTVVLGNKSLTQRYFGKPRHHVRTQGRTFRIEKQGDLVCLSWNPNSSSTPVFLKSTLNLNDGSGGTLNVEKIANSNYAQYIILTGNANFHEISIDDLITVNNMANINNDGTFLVVGVSDDGKVCQVVNPNAENQFSHATYTLTGNPNTGDQFSITTTIGTTTLVAGTDFVIGATNVDTALNLSVVLGTISGISSSVNSNIVTVTATSSSASILISYTPNGSSQVVVSGSSLVGDSFSSGDFSAYSEVSEGDSMIITSPFNTLNQGTFRVIRRYDDSVWFENENVVEEEVYLPLNSIDLGFDSSTLFMLNATNNSAYLKWTGTGTEPFLENAKMGDVITFGIDFASANRGDYMVLRSGEKLQEITQMIMPPGSQLSSTGAGNYFLINSAGDINEYYVWFNVGGGNSDPTILGKIGIEVTVSVGYTATQVATAAASVINVATGLTATSSSNALTVTTVGYQETTGAVNGTMPSPFVIDITQQGRITFLECINPSATNESVTVSSGVLNCHRPQIKFYEYEATIPEDIFVASGSSLLLANAGSYAIEDVVDQNTIVLNDLLTSVTNVSLSGQESSVYVKEGRVYTGYKTVLFVSQQPGTTDRTLVVFDTNNQYSKIDETAGVQLVSLNKMNYSTIIKQGLDSYKYNTGLIAEANRIIYGDPRDNATYPGVGASGADIFVREPLNKRVQVSIVVRLNTGVPFAQTVDRIQSSVGSLIKANAVGNSIAISSIVSVVNSISGVKAVSISSPQYDTTHDIIYIAPNEKARVINPVTDISVSKIG